VLRVADDAPPDEEAPPNAGLGIGAENVVQRLTNRYGPAASLTSARDADGFAAVLRLPLAA
jgi:LytS/YehU family sensor histidine kinase